MVLIVMVVFMAFVFACFFSFIGGLLLGRKQAAADFALDQKMQAQAEKDFKQLKESLFKRK